MMFDRALINTIYDTDVVLANIAWVSWSVFGGASNDEAVQCLLDGGELHCLSPL